MGTFTGQKPQKHGRCAKLVVLVPKPVSENKSLILTVKNGQWGKKEARNPRERETSAWVGVRTLSLHLIVFCYCLFLMTEETIASRTEAIFTSQMSSQDWQGWGKIKSDGGKNSSHQRTAPGPAGVAPGRKQHCCNCHCWRQESQTE